MIKTGISLRKIKRIRLSKNQTGIYLSLSLPPPSEAYGHQDRADLFMRMLRETELVGIGVITLLHSCFLSICIAKEDKYQMCSSSFCGDINISYPFRLQSDPSECGYPDYELICQNNRTMVILEYTRKYYGEFYVAEINYDNFTIRVVDPGITKGSCFSTPLYSSINFSSNYTYRRPDEWRSNTIVWMNCDELMSDGRYIRIIPCKTSTITPHSSSSPTDAYAVVGESVNVSDIPYSCTIGENIAIDPLKKAVS